MFRIDNHIGIAIAGLTSDARVLRCVVIWHLLLGLSLFSLIVTFVCICSNFMRQQAMYEQMIFNRPIPVNRIVNDIADSTFNVLGLT